MSPCVLRASRVQVCGFSAAPRKRGVLPGSSPSPGPPMLFLEIFQVLSRVARTNRSRRFYRAVLRFQHGRDSFGVSRQGNVSETAGI